MGGWLYTISIILPWLLNGLSYLVAVIIFSQIKVESNDQKNKTKNFYQIAGESLKHLKTHRKLRGLVLMSGMFLALFFSYKYLFPALFETNNIPVTELSMVMSVGILFLALGTKLSAGKYYIRLAHAIPLLMILNLMFGFGHSLIWLALITWGVYFLRGMFTIRTNVLINKYTSDSIRASVLSLRSVIFRILMSIYMLLAGKILGIWSFKVLYIFTFGILGIFVLYFIWIARSNLKLKAKSLK